MGRVGSRGEGQHGGIHGRERLWVVGQGRSGGVAIRPRRAGRGLSEGHCVVPGVLTCDALSSIGSRLSCVQDTGFPMYISRDLEAAKRYLNERYQDEPERRYGILASSRTQRFLPRFGVDSSWPATKRVNFAHWFNRARGEANAGSNLETVVTEFGCQGLERTCPSWPGAMTSSGMGLDGPSSLVGRSTRRTTRSSFVSTVTESC
jgi:hypothetical protein